MERIKTHQWSKKAVELFTGWTSGDESLTFLIESVESNRCFGQVLIYGHVDREPFSVVAALMEQDEAIQDRNYMNGECLVFNRLSMKKGNNNSKMNEIFQRKKIKFLTAFV